MIIKCKQCGAEHEQSDDCPNCGPFAYYDAIAEFRKNNPPPKGENDPSPVPFSIILQRPSPDLPQDGVEKFYMTAAAKDVETVTQAAALQIQSAGLTKFIKDVFDSGYHRLEIVVGDLSIKIYKHRNNP
jgi:hypothetical protein